MLFNFRPQASALASDEEWEAFQEQVHIQAQPYLLRVRVAGDLADGETIIALEGARMRAGSSLQPHLLRLHPDHWLRLLKRAESEGERVPVILHAVNPEHGKLLARLGVTVHYPVRQQMEDRGEI